MKVSVIMPCSRNEDIPRAIEVFLSQDWPDKTLLIGLDSLKGVDLSQYPDNIHTFYEGVKETIGTKRNRLVNASKGNIIIHQDSDDWYAPDWIARSVDHLIETQAAVTGLKRAYFYHPHTQLWEYSYTGGQPYVIGASLCYWRSVWERNKFPDKNEGEDLAFLANAGEIVHHRYSDGFMAMIHGKNTASHKQLGHMKVLNPELAKEILGVDYDLY